MNIQTKEFNVDAQVNEDGSTSVTLTLPAPETQVREDDDPITLDFFYHGVGRVVSNPSIVAGRDGALLCGFELYRGPYASGQIKNYRLSEIQPV